MTGPDAPGESGGPAGAGGTAEPGGARGAAGTGGAGAPGAGADLPRVLGNACQLTGAPGPLPAGALWRLAEPGRQLDANLVHLPAGRHVDTHAEPDLDVLLVVMAGEGALRTADGERTLTAGTMLWLPHGSSRALAAGPDGLSYLTVHRRRPGMRIGRREPPGGDAQNG